MKRQLLGILLVITACFVAIPPTQAQNTSDIVDRLNTSLGVQLPSQYQTTVKNFVKNSKILSDKDAQTFTEQFIKDQMKTGWGISKQNQLLFVWDAVYGQIIKDKQLYTGEDGNQARLDEFEKVMEKSEDCGKKYNNGFKAYMRQLSAEADRKGAEADRKGAEADRRGAEADRRGAEADQVGVVCVYSTLYGLIQFYTKRNSATESEIKQSKDIFNRSIKNFQYYKIDYQSLLPTEVQRFYGLNPVRQNSLTCEKAEVKTLNIVLQEIVKLYNIYQKAPQAKRKIKDIKDCIEDCKKHNIDYKSKLSPEVCKFFGIE